MGAMRAVRPRPFGLGWWVVLVTLGGLLSLFAPAFGFLLAERLGTPPWLTYPTVALAGAVMGLVLGAAQAGALSGTAVAVPRAGWTLVTSAGAMVAWAVGMLPVTLEQLGEPLNLASRPVLAALLAGAVVLVIAVPALQWLLLRRVVRKAWLWIPLTVVAAATGLGIAWVARQVMDPATADGALTGSLAMAAVLALAFALVTGVGLRWLAGSPRRTN